MSECLVWTRLQGVLERLGEVKGGEVTLVVRDDTLLHKLHSHIHNMLLSARDAGEEWGQKEVLLLFVQTLLDPSVAANAGNSASVVLALRVLASLVTVEPKFSTFEDSKALSLFLLSLPRVRNEPSLLSPALSLVMAIMDHSDGLLWLIKNGLWEKMLLPCLRSSSIFVQREGVTAIVTFIIKLKETQHFDGLVKDLYMLADKFCELRKSHTGSAIEAEGLRQSNIRVLNVFKQLYWQTLGKSAMYSKVRKVDDLNSHLVPILQHQISMTSATGLAELLILNMLHKFQEKLINYGIVEQFLLDSLCADMIALTRLLLERGYTEAFVRSSANVHKYWSVMTANMKEEHNIDLTSVEALLHIVTAFQVTSLLALYQSCVEMMLEVWPEKMKILQRWRDEVHSRIKTKEEVKSEAGKLERKMVASFCKNSVETIQLAITCINAVTANADCLNPVCAVTVFQALTFMLCSQISPSSPIKHHAGLQRAVIDSLRVLVERFGIDWRKCFASVCLMGKLCDMAKIPGLSPQVKVCALKAMNSCINGFVPPVMSMLVNSGHMEHNSVEQMGQVLAVYLGDVEWEVRDSALEVLITCMNLAKEKYPHFVDWLLRHHLSSAVVTALGDVEGYVRASAFTVLANIISIDKDQWAPVYGTLSSSSYSPWEIRFERGRSHNRMRVWAELETENLPHHALSAVLTEGEASVRRAALTLVQELFLAGKYSEAEVSGLVVRVVQHCGEDPDDEVRLAALDFIRTHILLSLNKAGMVDGEFPSVTFSRGKITKLNSEEVKSRVVGVLTWVCECGYLCVLLSGRRDLVTPVAVKAREVFCFLNDLVTKYQITQEDSGSRGAGGAARNQTSAGQKQQQHKHSPISESTKNESTDAPEETVISHLDQIDKTINEILSSSALENVATIRRQEHSNTLHCVPSPTSPISARKLVLTPKEMPPASPALPLTSLLQAFSTLCQPSCAIDDKKHQMAEMISLLDDILLEGERQQSHLDDQHLRDCY